MWIMETPVLQDLELKVLDAKFQFWNGDIVADSSVVIVSIDDGSLDYFDQNGMSWPWPRSFYAHVIDFLSAEGAMSIVFDMLFTHSDADRSDSDASETDSLFAAAIHRADNVVLGMSLAPSYFTGKLIGSFNVDLRSSSIIGGEQGEFPIPRLAKAAKGIGHTNISPDSDGIFRHVNPFASHDSLLLPNLATASLLTEASMQTVRVKHNSLKIGGQTVPLTHDHMQMINWYGPAGPKGVFKYYPFSAVIQSASARLNGGQPVLPPGLFKDKLVVIGADAAGLRDLKATPVMKNGMHPGMEVWATLISNMQLGHYIVTFHWLLQLTLLSIIAFIILFTFDRFLARNAFVIMLGQLLFYVLLMYGLWRGFQRIDLTLLPALMASFTAYLIVISNEMRERLFLRRVFGPYVAPELMDLMYQTREVPALGGEQVSGSAFFSDLQGFTTFSEELTPVNLVALLNEYLTDMTDTLMAHRGTLDKYEGDAIIAFFGAPIPDDKHAIQAVKAAINMQTALHNLRAKWASEGDKWPESIWGIQMRIGVNSGDMLVGNVGSEGRMNYTMMGDTVNVAARLESSAKQYGVLTHISEPTALLMPENIALRKLGATQLLGKTRSAISYEVLGFVEDLTEADRQLLKLWPQAMEAIANQEWPAAINILTQTLALERQYAHRPTNPSQVYLEIRIPHWQAEDHEADWQPVWIFNSK